MSDLQALVFIIIPGCIVLIAYSAVVYHERVRNTDGRRSDLAVFSQLIKYPFNRQSNGMNAGRLRSTVIFVDTLSVAAFIVATVTGPSLFDIPRPLVAFIGGLCVAIVFTIARTLAKETA